MAAPEKPRRIPAYHAKIRTLARFVSLLDDTYDTYREQLKTMIPPLLEKWQSAWGVKKMKTKWGSCNVDARRVWLNLELAKKPPQCLEYIVVHELVHLLERHHNERFTARMDGFMPQWRQYRDMLNKSPLGHEEWAY